MLLSTQYDEKDIIVKGRFKEDSVRSSSPTKTTFTMSLYDVSDILSIKATITWIMQK